MLVNPFEANDAFSMVSLTQGINLLPNSYGRIREMNLMPVQGVRTRTIIVEEKNGVLHLLKSQPVGSPGSLTDRAKRTVRSFVVPHIPHDDVILPAEYDGIRAFGSENETDALASIVNEHQQDMRNRHAITLEHLRMGALKGIILDADGSVLYDLYTEFGITQFTVDFELDTDTTDVRAKCMEVKRHIEDNLMGEVMNGVHALVSEEFFDQFVSHDSVKEAYLYHQEASTRLGTDMRKGFEFAGITFEEYRGQATQDDGATNRRFITAGDGHVFPTGTMSTFKTIVAPADFMETANTLGIELYSKMEPKKFNRGMDLHTQSNPLPICYRPGVLVRIFA
jgi:hypothetical protein